MQLRIFYAARNGDVDEVRRLVERERVDPDCRLRHSSQTPLHAAAVHGRISAVRYLAEEAQASFDLVDHKGLTALHFATFQGRPENLVVLRYLAENVGLSVHATTNDGRTPLHIACSNGHMEIICYLVGEKQANVDAKDGEGRTPLRVGLQSFPRRAVSTEIARYLLPRVSSVDKKIVELSWTRRLPWDLKELVLQKYSVGCQMADAFDALPVHTILRHLPLPSRAAYQECIIHLPLTALYLVDENGRLPIHIALTSRKEEVKSPRIISALMKRAPRSSLFRDPITGMYPFETAALISSDDYDTELGWFRVVDGFFRGNPECLLRARRGQQSLAF